MTKRIHGHFRGTSFHIADITEDMELLNRVERFMWENNVFETDGDPLWIFRDGELVMTWRLAHTHRGYTKGWPGDDDENIRVEEDRIVNVFDPHGEYVQTLCLNRRRELEEGELGEMDLDT